MSARKFYVAMAYLFALFYLAIDVGSVVSLRGTLGFFNWMANTVGFKGAMGDPSDTIALAFLFAYFMVLLIACFQCARDPDAMGPLVLVCAGKATSGTAFFVLMLTVRPAYGFIFVLDLFNILALAIPFWLARKSAARS